MNRTMRLTALAAGLLAIALAMAFGPVFAAYVFAGLAFAVILTLMGIEAVHAIDNWLLDHPRLRHPRSRA